MAYISHLLRIELEYTLTNGMHNISSICDMVEREKEREREREREKEKRNCRYEMYIKCWPEPLLRAF